MGGKICRLRGRKLWRGRVGWSGGGEWDGGDAWFSKGREEEGRAP